MIKVKTYTNSKESGQGAVEYGLILALIVIITIISINVLSDATNSLYVRAFNKIP